MKYILLTLVFLQSACSNQFWQSNKLSNMNPNRTMTFEDINHYRTDCGHKEEQLTFLRHQRDNCWWFDKQCKAALNYTIRYMEASCGEVKKKPQGCVIVREDLPPGTSHAVVCRDSHFKGPIVNKWEAEIEN